MSSSKLLLAAVSGIALGTLIGILVAPASGRETRKTIRKGAVGIKDTLAYRCLQAEDMLVKLRKQATSTAEHMESTPGPAA